MPAAQVPSWKTLPGRGAAGMGCAAFLVATLTLRLNSHILQEPAQALLLAAMFTVAGAIAGAAGGCAAVLLIDLLRRPFPRLPNLTPAAAGVLTALPLLYVLLLPDVGLAGSFLSDTLFSPSWLRRSLVAGAAFGVTAFIGVAADRWFTRRRHLGFALAAGIVLMGWILLAPNLARLVLSPPETAKILRPSEVPVAPSAAVETPLPAPVVLLLVDGADLDDVILPLAAAGELPTFARLLDESTWGPLTTLEPTLSAVVWTTIITGKAPEEHGIQSFVSFRLPGLSAPINEFPLHTGLNFHLFPLLEKLPGLPPLQIPYSSNMRRVKALWNMVDDVYPVGAYQWLITWPAEPVRGFNVAGGLGWVQLAGEFRQQIGDELAERASHPPELSKEIARARRLRRRALEPSDLIPYLGSVEESAALGDKDPRRLAAIGHLIDPAVDVLPALIERFEPRFTAASFYPVDPFSHFFAADRNNPASPFRNALDASYRLTDQRLGELIERLAALLGSDVNLLVISDHGWDFDRNHHTWAPAGMFFARGPAFEPGRQVEDLSIYDLAPMILHLLALPQPEDMPGTQTQAYLNALSATYRTAHPIPPRIATWETGTRPNDPTPVPSPMDDELRDTLRSLGYIQ
ncbi:MAG: alkaline phosphatase family protein [Acidobacteriota bacterium]